MNNHFRRWGAVWILLVLAVTSSIGHAILEVANAAQEAQWHGQLYESSRGWESWGRAALENLQSEWWQLLIQAVLVVGFASVLFRRSLEDLYELKGQVAYLVEAEQKRAGLPVQNP